MHKHQRHRGTGTALAGLLTAAFLVALATPAAAQIPEPKQGETSGAFGLAAGGVAVANSPAVSCGEGEQESQSSASASVPNIVSANALEANCDGRTSSASVANATVGSGPTAVRLGLIESQCREGVGSSSVVNLGSPNDPTDDQVLTGPSQITLPGLTVFLNETTSNQGATVQNAVRIVVGDPNNPTEEVILAQARCTPPGVVIPEVPLAVILPLSAVALFGAAYLVQRRRSAGAVAA